MRKRKPASSRYRRAKRKELNRLRSVVDSSSQVFGEDTFYGNEATYFGHRLLQLEEELNHANRSDTREESPRESLPQKASSRKAVRVGQRVQVEEGFSKEVSKEEIIDSDHIEGYTEADQAYIDAHAQHRNPN